MLKINEVTRLHLGIQGENLAQEITIDVSPWITTYPNGSVTIWHKRNGDAVPQPTGAVFDPDEKVVSWSPTSTDTYVAGEGVAEIRLIENSVIKKSRTVQTFVADSVTESGTPVGSSWQDYINVVDGMRAAAVTAKEAAEDAQTAAETAQGKAEDAQDAAETAQGKAEDAQTAAETAQGKAEDAQTAAETAQDKAEDAQTAAETAQDKAEDAQTAAETAQDKAEDAQTAAETAQGKAEDAQTAAETAQGKAEDAQTAAETAQGKAEDARDAAQAAAGDFQGLTATASGLAAGTAPTVAVTHSQGGLYNLAFGIPKGDKGDTGDPAPAEQVQPAVNAYLAQVITNPDSPPLDRTLSSSSAATPADITGSLKSAIDLNSSLDLTGCITIPYDWCRFYLNNYPLGWAEGYWQLIDGVISKKSSTKYIRTNTGSSISAASQKNAIGIILEPPEGFYIVVREVPADSMSLIRTITINEKTILDFNGTNRYLLYVGRFDDESATSHLTAEFISQIKMQYIVRPDIETGNQSIIKVPVEYTPTLYQNGIYASGGDNPSNYRISTGWERVYEGNTYRIALENSTYMIDCTVIANSNSSQATIKGRIPNFGNELVFTPNSDEKYIRFSIGRMDNAVMTSSDLEAVADALKKYTLTDRTSSKRYAPADAEQLGIIAAVSMGNTKSLLYDWSRLGGGAYGWRNGYYGTTNGEPNGSAYWIRTRNVSVNVKDAIGYIAEPPDGYSLTITKYDQNGTYVGYDSITSEKIFPANNYKLKFTVGRFDNADSEDYAVDETFINSIKLTILYSNAKESKNPRTGNFEWFSVKVDRPLSFGGQEAITTQQEIECVLRLPTSYKMTGDPTQLVLACHGAHGYIQKSTGTWYNDNWETFMDALLDAGYAVFDANIFPTSMGTSYMGRAYGSPLYVNVLKKAYDYIVENYNVTRKIFAHGTSMGGLGASAFSHAYPQLVLAESSFAGRNIEQYINFIKNGTATLDFAMAYGYESVESMNADKFSHVEGTFDTLSLVKYVDGVAQMPPDRETDYQNWLAYFSEIHGLNRNSDPGVWAGRRRVPYMAWNSWVDGDSEAYGMEQLVLKKAYNRMNACPYYVINYESGTHTQMSYGQINNMIPQLIAWYKRWENYVPTEEPET